MVAASWQSKMLSSWLLLLLLWYPCRGQEVYTPSADSRSRRLIHGAGAHRKFYCDLNDVPVTQVALNETIGKVYQVNVTDNTAPSETYAVKPCGCFVGLMNGTSYCPADSTYCIISVAYTKQYQKTQVENHDPSAECFRDTSLKSFGRSVFNYWAVVMSGIVVFLIWSGTGRHIIRYVISRCYNPDVNRNYVERTLRREITSQRQHFFRWRERYIAEGCFVGLKIKTKLYHSKAREDKHAHDDVVVDMCSICIHELKDRDRVADLTCKHYFHADCLSEWIKKKNSCPLCQEEGIAKEVRSYDIEIGPDSATIENADALNGLSTV